MSTERTTLFPETRPSPSYVFPGRHPRSRQRQVKQFQCCICATFLVVFVLAVVITISYTVNSPDVSEDNHTSPSPHNSYIALNGSEIMSMFVAMPWPIKDEPADPFQLPIPTPAEAQASINSGIKALGDREIFEETVSSPAVDTPSFRHQRAVSTSMEARKHAKRGFVENYATLDMAKKSSIVKPNRRWNIGKGPAIKLIDHEPAACNFESRYRTANGTCNNRHNPSEFGVALIPFRRSLNPDYADGISKPRESHSGAQLPSAREVSLGVHRPMYSNDPHFTVMFAVWGQFLDHDITATALTQGQDGTPIECCDSSKPLHPECFPVPLKSGDPYFDKYNVTCMSFIRSAPAPTSKFGPREQLNQVTAFIDGSAVYGADDKLMNDLRTKHNGSLRMYRTPDNRTLLPVSTDTKDGCNEDEMNAKGKYCFASGDARSNENLHLTSMHLIWARHHNYIAKSLQEINPHWDDETVFQESRKLVGAQIQHITYNEFVPILLGENFTSEIGLSSDETRTTDTYDETVNPAIDNAFAAAAFRFAHTLLPGLMRAASSYNKEGIELHKMLFNPYSLWGQRGVDDALKSAVDTPLGQSHANFTKELTEKLFMNNNATGKATKKSFGLDLVSLNIQRGRDHGLPSYPEWRKHCHLPAVDTWEEMALAVDNHSLSDMQRLFKDPTDVDFYTGALSEPPLEDALMGPLITCILTDQFYRIKAGDSHWYERDVGPQKFTKEQRAQIFKTTLAAVICRNADAVDQSQKYVMARVSADNPTKKCSQLDSFSFVPWKEATFQGIVKVLPRQTNVLIMNGNVSTRPLLDD